MNIEEIKEKLENVLMPKRYIHSVNVMHTSVSLARRYSEAAEEAAYAGLLHDCARDLDRTSIFEFCKKYGVVTDEITNLQPELLHGRLGAYIARDEFGTENPRILDAISSHTMGCRGMSLLSRIVFVADYIEPSRTYPGVDAIRKTAFENLERAMILGIDSTVGYLLRKGALVHPDTVNTRNWVLTTFRM